MLSAIPTQYLMEVNGKAQYQQYYGGNMTTWYLVEAKVQNSAILIVAMSL